MAGEKNKRTPIEVVEHINAKGSDVFISESFLNGQGEWDFAAVLTGLCNVHELAEASFFQDKNNFPKLSGVYSYVSDDNMSVVNGNPNCNIANMLAMIPLFRRTPMCLDFDFLNYSFDGVNTPGIFALIACDKQWVSDIRKMHDISFVELVSSIYSSKPFHNSVEEDTEAFFRVSKKLAQFINSLPDFFESKSGDVIRLLASPDDVCGETPLAPIEFVNYQFEVMSLAWIANNLDSQLNYYTSTPPEADAEILFESISALIAFDPAYEAQILDKIEDLLGSLSFPTSVVDHFKMLINNFQFKSVSAEHLSEELHFVPSLY